MNYLAHRWVADQAAKSLQLDPADAEAFVQGSTDPDYADDVAVWFEGRWVTHVGPYRLCSLTHFARPVGEGRIVGYCFGHDGGIPKLRRNVGKLKANLPLEPAVRGSTDLLSVHPLTDVLEDHRVSKDGKKLTTITFPSSAAMARFYQEQITTGTHWYLGGNANLLGRAAHMLMDACVVQHTTATLGAGHSVDEAKIDEFLIHGAQPSTLIQRSANLRTGPVDDLYTAVQLAAERTQASAASWSPEKALTHGLAWTCTLLEMAMVRGWL